MILELKDITLSFTDKKDSFKILNGVNFAIQENKVTALIGGNGAGKTTLFNIISGFQKADTGEVFFRRENINSLRPNQISRKGIGRLFQGSPLFQDLTLLENMCLGSDNTAGEIPFSYLFNKRKINKTEKIKEEQAIVIFNKLFGTGNKYIDMLRQKGSEFSYGEQRLLSLARLFMGNYSLLLLDEPTAGVNPIYIDTIKTIILQMIEQNNMTILLIEHNMPFVNSIADYCAYMSEGKIICEGPTQEVMENQEVKNNYLGMKC